MELIKQEVLDSMMERVSELEKLGQLDLPKDYSAGNALRAAWLHLQQMTGKDAGGAVKPILNLVTETSVVSALMKMVIDGLSVSKNQGAFIAYGNELKWQVEYQGRILMAKRQGLRNVQANVIYEGDEFSYVINMDGTKTIVKHDQKFENIDNTKIKGAYAVCSTEFRTWAEVMTSDQIKAAWNMAKGGITKAHREFPDQMACKTVISRALKTMVNSASDEHLFDEAPQFEVVEQIQAALPEQVTPF